MPLKILIIEDDQLQRELWNMFFDKNKFPHSVAYAINYDDAFSRLAEYFDVVVSDYYLEKGEKRDTETGADFLCKYVTEHRKDKNSLEKPVAILYSSQVEIINHVCGFYLIRREDVKAELLKKIESLEKKTEQSIFNSIIDNRGAIGPNHILKPQQENTPMPKIGSYQWGAIVAFCIASAGVIGSFAVNKNDTANIKDSLQNHVKDQRITENETIKMLMQIKEQLARVETKIDDPRRGR